MDSPYYQIAESAASHRPWRVLVLLELNRLLVDFDSEAKPKTNLSWATPIELSEGYRMYIRPGAEDFVRCLLEATRKECTLGIFTGISLTIAVPMVVNLFKKSGNGWNWKADMSHLSQPSVISETVGICVYIFPRTQHKEADVLSLDGRLVYEQESRALQADFEKVWSYINNIEDHHFHQHNTVLIASQFERMLCSENVLCLCWWQFWEDGNYMKEMRNAMARLFHSKPDRIKDWLRPDNIQYHTI